MRIIKYVVLLILLALASPAWATSYYVDFAGGNNASAGTSTGAAWKNLPGTCTVASSNDGSGTCTYVTHSGWVTINAGDIIKIKSGTTHDNSIGGRIHLASDHYATNATVANPMTIMRDSTWGSGAVTIDGAGVVFPTTGFGLLHDKVGGFKFDGVTDNGIVIQNAYYSGISSYTSGGSLQGPSAYYVKFYNNGTAAPDSSTSSSDGDVKLWKVTGGVFQHCYLDGNGTHMNGFMLGGDGGIADNVMIDNVVVENHSCGSGDGDWGIGVKSHSSKYTLKNSTLRNNFKGSDNGNKISGSNPIVKFINNLVYNNVENGLNGNSGKAVSITGTMTMYLINNIIYNNGRGGTYGHAGHYFYGGDANVYIVGNVFDNNGNNGTYSSSNINISNNNSPMEDSVMRSYLYNNIFYKPYAGDGNYVDETWLLTTDGTRPPSNFSLYSDYNSWVQNTTEYFARWGSLSPSYPASDRKDISYGANGPGHGVSDSGGNWYNWYGGSTTAPANGLGHYQQDSHSKGTGAYDNTLPPFTDRTNHDYTLTASYPGMDLSGQPWYISEMGLDRLGNTRATWDIGAHEYVSGSSAPVLITPIDNATAGWPVDFTWEVFAGAVLYQLQVDNNSDFSSPEIDDATINPDAACDETDCHYIVASGEELSSDTHYYWRVRAMH